MTTSAFTDYAGKKARIERGSKGFIVSTMISLADDGDVKAQYIVGLMYSNGEGVIQDYFQAAKWYKKAAEKGLASAQSMLGIMYRSGTGVPQNYDQALEWCRKAAEQGDADAQSSLAGLYDQGQGVTQDHEQAAKWYTKAAQQGHHVAQSFLANMYMMGRGVVQDNKLGYMWWNLARLYGADLPDGLLDGIDEKIPPSELKEAIKMPSNWLFNAAEHGDADAQAVLGRAFLSGRAVTKDYKQALKWYTKAAEQGNPGAQNFVAQALADSTLRGGKDNEGVILDFVKAYMWMNIASSGDKEYAHYRDLIAENMSPSQLEEAQEMSRDWVSNHK